MSRIFLENWEVEISETDYQRGICSANHKAQTSAERLSSRLDERDSGKTCLAQCTAGPSSVRFNRKPSSHLGLALMGTVTLPRTVATLAYWMYSVSLLRIASTMGGEE